MFRFTSTIIPGDGLCKPSKYYSFKRFNSFTIEIIYVHYLRQIKDLT